MEALGGFAVFVLLLAGVAALFFKKWRKHAGIVAGVALVVIIAAALSGPDKTDSSATAPNNQPSPASPPAEKAPPPPAQQAAKNPAYQDINLTDFKLDQKKLIGKKIRISGVYQMTGDIETLSAEGFDTNPVWVDSHNLTRDERKALLECATSQCTIEFEGVVRNKFTGATIVADKATKL